MGSHRVHLAVLITDFVLARLGVFTARATEAAAPISAPLPSFAPPTSLSQLPTPSTLEVPAKRQSKSFSPFRLQFDGIIGQSLGSRCSGGRQRRAGKPRVGGGGGAVTSERRLHQ